MDKKFMRRALELAKNGIGFTSPNPAVGCVIVKNGKVVAEAWHKKAGEAHAEIEAMKVLKEDPSGCEMYVTLEPCAHEGRTGSCAKALVEAGFKKVYVGIIDPFEKVAGKGVEILQEGGVDCELFDGDDELVKELGFVNQPFLKSVKLGLPYVTMKAGVSLDGRVATAAGDSKWITDEVARQDGRLERSIYDAVLVGAGTANADDPELAAHGKWKDKALLRIVVGPRADLDPNLHIFRDANVLYACGEVTEDRVKYYAEHGIELIENFGTDAEGIEKFFRLLVRRGVQSVFVEGGSLAHGHLYDAFLENGSLLDQVLFYYAPKVIGGSGSLSMVGANGVRGLQECPELENLKFEPCGNGFKVRGFYNFYC